MSPWESFFSSRSARRRSPIIMRVLFHAGKLGSKYKLAEWKVKHLMQVGATRRERPEPKTYGARPKNGALRDNPRGGGRAGAQREGRRRDSRSRTGSAGAEGGEGGH